MTDLTPFVTTREAIEAALARARYRLVHATPAQLPAPYFLVDGDLDLPSLQLTTGTLVVTGALTVSGPVDLHQVGRPIVNLIVAGRCKVHLAYVDAFLCVGADLEVGTLIADSNWSGGVFVAGALRGHTLVIHACGVEVDGDRHVERVADCDDEEAARHVLPGLFAADGTAQPRGLFIALRDSSPNARPAAAGKAKVASKASQEVGKASQKAGKAKVASKARPVAGKARKVASKAKKVASKAKKPAGPKKAAGAGTRGRSRR